ncbi:hypothetical protein A3K73_00860 [Candidatus Pacearchaeota archaeon RBG_13_36_9]|nr:MAG: hypothetical protein A3K73_00860 [Candidatus Pacearchaeota archaeon RBG_13_36_9]
MQTKKCGRIAIYSFLLYSGLLITGTVGNWWSNNYEKRGLNNHCRGNSVWLLDSEHASKEKEDDGIHRHFVFRDGRIFSLRSYIDCARENLPLDAKVDQIRISNLFGASFLDRNVDYASNKPDFDKGDAILTRRESKYSDVIGN